MEIDVGKVHDRVKEYWKDIKSKLTSDNPKSDSELDKLQKILDNKDYYTLDYLQLCREQKEQQTKRQISFMDKQTQSPNKEYTIKYIQLLEKYNLQKIIQDEIKLNTEQLTNHTSNTSSLLDKKKCSHCKGKEFITNTEQNIDICSNCGIQTEKMDNYMSYKELSRINTSIKYKYERHIHFKDAMNQFQGKQNVTILPNVYRDINQIIERSNIDRTKITREQIILFLKITGHTKHYEDVSLIYSKISGNPIADISHLEDKLLNDFEQVSETYDLLFKSDQAFERKSFINTHYILYQLLKKHKFPCSKQDFNILKTLDRKAFHDEVGQKIFQHLEWNLTPLF